MNVKVIVYGFHYTQDHRSIACNECEKECPYQLPIRDMLVENIAFYREPLGAAGSG